MNAFETLGWQVKPFIVGDGVPLSWIVKGSEQSMRRSTVRVLLADLMRIGMRLSNGRRALSEPGSEVDWVYERFAAFQSLGGSFKKHGALWILETNAPLFIESKLDRKTIVLSSLARYLEEKAYRDCDVLVCISEELKQIILDDIDIPSEKIFVMPNGVDVNLFDPEQYQANRIYEGFTIGFVGGLTEWQGLDSLLETAGNLRAEGLDINLVFVGSGPQKEFLEKTAAESGMVEHCRFVGHVSREDVPTYIAGFDVGYSGQIPLKMGSMYLSPLKLYEYMAMAKPAIASNFKDARSVIVDRETGFLFSSGNKRQLCEAIRAAYESRSKLHHMGEQARATIVRNHSWQVRVESLIEFIETAKSRNSS
jgi:glycosyltransferase involved in cell wall biosynthesis